jgi:hypothetical protein
MWREQGMGQALAAGQGSHKYLILRGITANKPRLSQIIGTPFWLIAYHIVVIVFLPGTTALLSFPKNDKYR